MRVVVGADHGGFAYKDICREYLEKNGITVIDVGCFDDKGSAWSEYGIKAAEKVANGDVDLGVVICRSGVGIAMAANKVKGAYCGVAWSREIAQKLKQHDHCNMIAFGADYISANEMLMMLTEFIQTYPEGGRHLDRFKILQEYEKNH